MLLEEESKCEVKTWSRRNLTFNALIIIIIIIIIIIWKPQFGASQTHKSIRISWK